MLSPSYLDGVAEPLQAIFSELQTVIQEDIAKRLFHAGQITSASEWQIIKLLEMGQSQAEVQRAISRALQLTDDEIARIFRDAGLKSIKDDIALQREAIRAGLLSPDISPLGATEAFKQTMNANAVRTANTLKKLTGTIAIDATGKLNQYMDLAQMMVQSGGFQAERAVEVAVRRFAADGVNAFDYFSGHRTTIEAAVRRACVTGVNQATAEISLNNAKELDADLVEVTSHADARPYHAVWQGGIYSISGRHPKYQKLTDATGYGTVTGLCGANCRHSFYPFIPGVSERIPKERYSSKTYELEQEQRYNERMIRHWKRRAATLEAGKVDPTAAKKKIREWQKKQQEFVKEHDLARLYDRERVY